MSYLSALRDTLIVAMLKSLSWLISTLPLFVLHYLGKSIGSIAYILHRNQRKRVMSNLAIARDLQLTENELRTVSRQAFQNLYISTFEYFAIKKVRQQLTSIVRCENPDVLIKLQQQQTGIILVACHQANWEMAFIQGSAKNQGAVVGQAFTNKALQAWALSIREMNNGQFVDSRNAVLNGMKLLMQGKPVGIAIDHALPSSSYCYSFFGVRSFITTTPAIWAYKTACPVVVVTTRREGRTYVTHLSQPLWANTNITMQEDVVNMMNTICHQLEMSIKDRPGEYLWQHNRWQQDFRLNLKKRFRHDVILVIFPLDIQQCRTIFPSFSIVINALYPKAFITILTPYKFAEQATFDTLIYQNHEEIYIRDWKYQLVINLSKHAQRVRRHFLRLAAFEVVDFSEYCTHPKELEQVMMQSLSVN